jgi:hypothetical protein
MCRQCHYHRPRRNLHRRRRHFLDYRPVDLQLLTEEKLPDHYTLNCLGRRRHLQYRHRLLIRLLQHYHCYLDYLHYLEHQHFQNLLDYRHYLLIQQCRQGLQGRLFLRALLRLPLQNTPVL